MCGIAGYHSLSYTFDDETLSSFVQKLHHRGPDANGTFREGKVGLAHNRLSIIDISDSGNQPLVSNSGRYVIVYNGEVYNFKELKEKYHISTKGTSDTEIILELFEILGDKCVEQMRGMFALVIYDREEQSLTIMRDRLGIKPLYYYHDNESFVFASELKGLSDLPQIKKHLTIDIEASNHYLHLGFIPSPRSIFNEIKKFPSGHVGKLDKNGKLTLTPYWKVESYIGNNGLSHAESKKMIKDLLIQSISEHLISDVPIGLFLSGGIDSSLLAVLANEIQPNKLKTFTIGFKNGHHDEAPIAKKIADYIGLENECAYIGDAEIISIFNKLKDVYDEPFGDTSSIPTMFVSELASKNVKVVLSGEGADELFLGYGSHIWANRLNDRIFRLSKAPFNILNRIIKNPKIQKGHSMLSIERDRYIAAKIYSIEHELFSTKQIESISNIQHYKGYDFLLNNDLFINQILFEIKIALEDGLLVKMDRASMQFGLEARVPYLDHRIVEFALTMNKKDIGKKILKEILFELVPEKLFSKNKWGFGISSNNALEDYINSIGISEKKENESLSQMFCRHNTHFIRQRS